MTRTRSTVGTWTPAPPPVPRLLVVVAPHPDDEVLGAGGILRWADGEGAATAVVACSDGEASHGRSRLVAADELRRRRAEERADALDVLGVDPHVVRLGHPDGQLAAHEDEIVASLAGFGGDGVTFVVPWVHDGHPDHEAVGRAGRAAAAATGAQLWPVPIWAKVRREHPLPEPVARLVLSPEVRRAKADAVDRHRSQLVALGPAPEDGPVVHPTELAAMLDGTEVVLP